MGQRPRLYSAPEEIPQHFPYEDGALVHHQYVIIRLIGDGTFGRVLEVLDRSDRKLKALKLVKKHQMYIQNAKNEETIIRSLHADESEYKRNVVRIYSSFELDGYYCLVFERLGGSLYEVLERRALSGFSLSEIQRIGKQVLQALVLMHQHSLTHCDLKPENILLVNDGTTYNKRTRKFQLSDLSVKVIDFGDSTYSWEYHSPVITTPAYRAPEVLLGKAYIELDWNESADIWSLGCILVELWTGKQLFPSAHDYDHLAMMERVLGRIPTRMVRMCGNRLKRCFNGRLQLKPPEAPLVRDEEAVDRTENLNVRFPQDLINSEHRDFRHAVSRMLEFSPQRRISASDALKEPFFSAIM